MPVGISFQELSVVVLNNNIIPRARMGSESIAIDLEAMRARGIRVLVKSN